DAAALRQFLRECLPDYMVPSALVELPALPLTPGGKIDRGALPVEIDRFRDPRSYVAPRDALEIELSSIWGRILGLAKVGIHDDFFDFGGPSLQAVRMLAEVERAFGTAPALRRVIEGPTVAQLAAVIRENADHRAHAAMRLLNHGRTEVTDASRLPLI